MKDSGFTERRFFIVAGEASGDRHGAALMAALRHLDPSCRFTGIGGPCMQALRLERLYTVDEMALVGFSEVIRRLPFFRRALSRTCRTIRDRQPERVILIDYPGFNLRLAERLRAGGIPVTYYISPQLWAWREGRIRTIRRCVDQMLVIFPFEEEWYRRRGVPARFVGHPLLDEPEPDVPRETYLTNLGLDSSRPVLTLFPGSRQQELIRHLDLFVAASRLVQAELPAVQVILGLASGLEQEPAPGGLYRDLLVVADRPRMALRYADAAIVASGTATLEGAVWGTPMVVVYRMASLSWWLSRRLVKVPWVGMVNLLAGEEVAPEFLQERAQPGPIARATLRYLQDEARQREVTAKLDRVRRSLMAPGSGTTSEVAAEGESAARAGRASLQAARLILGK